MTRLLIPAFTEEKLLYQFGPPVPILENPACHYDPTDYFPSQSDQIQGHTENLLASFLESV